MSDIRIASVIILSIACAGAFAAADGGIGGVVSDHLGTVALQAGDVTYRGNGESGSLTVEGNGQFSGILEGNLWWTIRVDIPGYTAVERAEYVPASGSNGTADFALVRSSVLTELTLSGTAFFEGEHLTGTITLSGAFPRAATVVDLSVLVGDGSQVQLQDAFGTPLTGGTITIAKGDASVDFRLVGLADTVVESDQDIQLRASAAAIPSPGDEENSPVVTLRDIKRVVSLSFGGAEGTVFRYDSLLGGPTSDQATVGGTATFKGQDSAETAGFRFEPVVAKPN